MQRRHSTILPDYLLSSTTERSPRLARFVFTFANVFKSVKSMHFAVRLVRMPNIRLRTHLFAANFVYHTEDGSALHTDSEYINSIPVTVAVYARRI